LQRTLKFLEQVVCNTWSWAWEESGITIFQLLRTRCLRFRIQHFRGTRFWMFLLRCSIGSLRFQFCRDDEAGISCLRLSCSGRERRLPRFMFPSHSSFVPVSYMIALMISQPEDTSGSWLPSYAAQPVLLAILSMRVLICAQICLKEWSSPFSAGKAVADWLESAGLAGHPLVVQPELPAPTVLAYTGAASAYFPACQCSRPYVLYSRGWNSQRGVTLPELRALKASTGL
jgi:hypothetical protein